MRMRHLINAIQPSNASGPKRGGKAVGMIALVPQLPAGLPALLSISQQAQQLSDVLLPYAAKSGGDAQIVSNLQMLWMQASMANDRPRILICYNGEQSRGEFSVAAANHRVDRQWIVAVTRGRGWSASGKWRLTRSASAC